MYLVSRVVRGAFALSCLEVDVASRDRLVNQNAGAALEELRLSMALTAVKRDRITGEYE